MSSLEEMARAIAWKVKLGYLAGFTESEFRDKVVRPLYEQQGYTFVRDTCGPEEEGKDCIFTQKVAFDEVEITAVQTKRGDISMGSDPGKSVQTLLTQVNMAFTADICLPGTKVKRAPEHVHVCISGKISGRARSYIIDHAEAATVRVYDASDLIPHIDRMSPEFWLGIDPNRFPYLRALQKRLRERKDAIFLTELGSGTGDEVAPIDDDGYIQVFASHSTKKVSTKRRLHKIESELEDIPAEKILQQQSRRILLLGDGGSGKTIALRRAACVCIEQLISKGDGAPIPVLLDARAIAAADDGLLDLITAEAYAVTNSSDPAFDMETLARGDVAVLIDGLDEVTKDGRRIVAEKIRGLLHRYPDCRVVIASREYKDVVSDPNLLDFERYRIVPVRLKHVEKVVQLCAKRRAVEPQLAREVLRRLKEVHGLSLTPMLVTVFLASNEFSKQDLPPNITEIFSKFTEYMLGRWDQTKGLKQQYQAPIKDLLLCQLAFDIHAKGQTSAPLADFERLLANELKARDLDIDSDSIFDEVVHRSGLLVVDGATVRFRHHLLQEFFAGRGVPDAAFFADHLHDPWWRVPIVFHFGSRPKAYNDLRELYVKLKHTDAELRFESAITVGLAAQACYWAKAGEKVEALGWVVETLARCDQAFAGSLLPPAIGEKPALAFLVTYLMGRDAVGGGAIGRVAEHVRQADDVDQEHERQMFWCIVGLLEAGEIKHAVSLIEEFNPQDERLLLCIDFGVNFYLHVRGPTEVEKKLLKRAAGRLDKAIGPLRSATVHETKSLIVEMRQGKLAQVDTDEDEDEPEPHSPE